MTLQGIESFLAIVKFGNLSSAAKYLYITQPALTRRVQQLEDELGYLLLKRQKGLRTIQLTEQGVKFYQIAWKWQLLLEETEAIPYASQKEILSVASVNSVGRPLLIPIFPTFLQNGYRLRLYNAFSEDAYQQMARGLYDLAFIEQQEFTEKLPVGIHMKPTFSEAFVLTSGCELPAQGGAVDIQKLDSSKEVYVPWNNDFKAWHSEQFSMSSASQVFLEDASVLDCFLRSESWSIVPYSTGELLRKQGCYVYLLSVEPPRRIIYYLTKGNVKQGPIQSLLILLNEQIHSMPKDRIYSLLQHI
jgi:DNA-binding transcriptional LysR family regulator